MANSHFGSVDDSTVLLNMSCSGYEYNLAECGNIVWGYNDGPRHRQAGVICKGSFHMFFKYLSTI